MDSDRVCVCVCVCWVGQDWHNRYILLERRRLALQRIFEMAGKEMEGQQAEEVERCLAALHTAETQVKHVLTSLVSYLQLKAVTFFQFGPNISMHIISCGYLKSA